MPFTSKKLSVRTNPRLFLLILGLSVYILSLQNSAVRVVSRVIIQNENVIVQQDAPHNTHAKPASHTTIMGDTLKNTSSSSSTSCRRPCPFRRNLIVLDHFGAAGLNDRGWIFYFMANLAGYLCATVYAPPPWTMLSIEHNGGTEVPKNLQWDDFFTLTFHEDQSMALQQYKYDMPMPNRMEPFNLREVLSLVPPPSTTTGHDPLIRLSLKQPAHFIPQLEYLDLFVMEQQRNGGDHNDTAFVWEIYKEPYHYSEAKQEWRRNHTADQRQAMPEDGCPYVGRNTSQHARTIVSKVWDRIHTLHPTTTSFAVLHIRRGDAISQCNTSLPDMHDYLFCSFAQRKEVVSHYGNITLLLASDERDPCYRTAMKELIAGGLGFGVMDLDETIAEVVQDYAVTIPDGDRLQNNMFSYQISTLLAWDPRMKFFLEKRRRQACPLCANVLGKFGRSSSTTTTNNNNSTNSSSREPNIASQGWSFANVVNDYELCRDPTKWRR